MHIENNEPPRKTAIRVGTEIEFRKFWNGVPGASMSPPAPKRMNKSKAKYAATAEATGPNTSHAMHR